MKEVHTRREGHAAMVLGAKLHRKRARLGTEQTALRCRVRAARVAHERSLAGKIDIYLETWPSTRSCFMNTLCSIMFEHLRAFRFAVAGSIAQPLQRSEIDSSRSRL
jgi:hypothetical protein